MTLELLRKPWGYERLLVDAEDCGAKVLYVWPGGRLSLQRHFQRHETWYVISGTGWMTLQASATDLAEEWEISQGEVIRIPALCWHRVKAITDLQLVEIVPKYVRGDIERREDDYARV